MVNDNGHTIQTLKYCTLLSTMLEILNSNF